MQLTSANREYILKNLEVSVSTLQGGKKAVKVKVDKAGMTYSFYSAEDVTVALTYVGRKFSQNVQPVQKQQVQVAGDCVELGTLQVQVVKNTRVEGLHAKEGEFSVTARDQEGQVVSQ